MSKLFTANGNIKNLNETKRGVPFFRKTSSSEIELAIARKVMRNPHPNVVKIYAVGPNYIDMEMLDVSSVTSKYCRDHMAELRRAKNHLHKNGIVYLDWKPDNMGISYINGKIKVFDFDMSGLLRRRILFVNNWKIEPALKGFLLRHAEEAGQLTPIKADDWIFDHRFMKNS
jgi:serine/threonine protein kinase